MMTWPTRALATTVSQARAERSEGRGERLVDRRRHAHDDGVGRRDGRGVVGQVEALAVERGRQADVVLGQEVDRELADRGDPGPADLEADDGAADLLEAEGDREADVPETDDGDGREVERPDDGREHRGVGLVDVHDPQVTIGEGIASQDRRVRRINV